MARVTKRANSIVTSGWDANGQMWFQVRNHKKFTFDTTKAHSECQFRARMSGWEDRIIDAAAVSKSDKDGNLIPDAVRFDTMDKRMRALAQHYESGTAQWALRSESIPDMRDQWVKQAVAETLKWNVDVLETKLAQLAEKRRESMGQLLEYFRTKEGNVRTRYLEIRAEAEKSDGMSDELLTELEELE